MTDEKEKHQFHTWVDDEEEIDGMKMKRCTICGLKIHRVNWRMFYT